MRMFFAVLASIVLMGCGDPNVRKINVQVTLESGLSKQVYEWFYKGHTYLIMGDKQTGFSITHAGHCPCQSKR